MIELERADGNESVMSLAAWRPCCYLRTNLHAMFTAVHAVW